ncbi:hypothetical protein CE91St63_19280 [[Clostridium] hylemonae]|nr:hypothetical protein CE91St63_19280 [[Clostridium] hylemonae]
MFAQGRLGDEKFLGGLRNILMFCDTDHIIEFMNVHNKISGGILIWNGVHGQDELDKQLWLSYNERAKEARKYNEENRRVTL